MVEPGVATGYHEMVDIAEERDEAGTALRRGLGELLNHRRIRGELPDQRQQRCSPCQLGALMRCAERHESVYSTGRLPGVARNSVR